ncbi:uncharacterized protein DS421_1g15280 [Arachis hypogaea]|nr:uncharacterized protein DS421_1g15280 [Arachis hypogaea]
MTVTRWCDGRTATDPTGTGPLEAQDTAELAAVERNGSLSPSRRLYLSLTQAGTAPPWWQQIGGDVVVRWGAPPSSTPPRLSLPLPLLATAATVAMAPTAPPPSSVRRRRDGGATQYTGATASSPLPLLCDQQCLVGVRVLCLSQGCAAKRMKERLLAAQHEEKGFWGWCIKIRFRVKLGVVL